MAKRKFKPGDLVTMKSRWLPESGVIQSFAYYYPPVKAHATGNRRPVWNVLCNDGKITRISEEYMVLVNRNDNL